MTKLIERYVILDKLGNIVENPEDVKSVENKLRVYDRELMRTITTVHSGDLNLNLYAARGCVAALEDYIPPEPVEIPNGEGDENNGD